MIRLHDKPLFAGPARWLVGAKFSCSPEGNDECRYGRYVQGNGTGWSRLYFFDGIMFAGGTGVMLRTPLEFFWSPFNSTNLDLCNGRCGELYCGAGIFGVYFRSVRMKKRSCHQPLISPLPEFSRTSQKPTDTSGRSRHKAVS